MTSIDSSSSISSLHSSDSPNPINTETAPGIPESTNESATAGTNANSNNGTYLGDETLCIPNETFFKKSQDVGAPHVDPITGCACARKPRRTYHDKGTNILYRETWQLATLLHDVYSKRKDIFVKFNDTKSPNHSRNTEHATK